MDRLFKDIYHFILSIVVMMLMVLVGAKMSLAASGTFYVQPILPDNQLSDASDYYHIKVNEDTKQTLAFMIVNESDEEQVLDVSVLDGMTTSMGEISYGKDQQYDKSQIIKLSEVLNGSGEKKVPANGSLKVEMKLDLSIKNFTGQLLGAINVSEKQEDDVKKGGVNNQFAYNIPIKIDVKETKIPAKMDYSGVKVKEETTSYDLEVSLRNLSATIIRDLSITYEITSKNGNKKILDETNQHLEVAPNSLFFPKLSLKNTDVKSGEYNITIHAISKESNIDETWKDTFKISREEASHLNNGLVVSNNGLNLWIIVSIIAISLIVIGMIIYKRIKNKK